MNNISTNINKLTEKIAKLEKELKECKYNKDIDISNNIDCGLNTPFDPPSDITKPAIYFNTVSQQLYFWDTMEHIWKIICRGEKGEQGVQGEKGIQGDQGNRGSYMQVIKGLLRGLIVDNLRDLVYAEGQEGDYLINKSQKIIFFKHNGHNWIPCNKPNDKFYFISKNILYLFSNGILNDISSTYIIGDQILDSDKGDIYTYGMNGWVIMGNLKVPTNDQTKITQNLGENIESGELVVPVFINKITVVYSIKTARLKGIPINVVGYLQEGGIQNDMKEIQYFGLIKLNIILEPGILYFIDGLGNIVKNEEEQNVKLGYAINKNTLLLK